MGRPKGGVWSPEERAAHLASKKFGWTKEQRDNAEIARKEQGRQNQWAAGTASQASMDASRALGEKNKHHLITNDQLQAIMRAKVIKDMRDHPEQLDYLVADIGFVTTGEEEEYVDF